MTREFTDAELNEIADILVSYAMGPEQVAIQFCLDLGDVSDLMADLAISYCEMCGWCFSDSDLNEDCLCEDCAGETEEEDEPSREDEELPICGQFYDGG